MTRLLKNGSKNTYWNGLEHLVAKCVVLEKKNTMPARVDKTTRNSAIQGISEQEDFMIKILFICHGRSFSFV